MALANAHVLSTESANDIKNKADTFHTQNVPTKQQGRYYFAKANDVVGLEGSELTFDGEFVETDQELADAKVRQTIAPIYDTRSGAKHIYVSNAWSIAASATLWGDIGVGRLVHNPATKKTYFVAGFGNVLSL